MSDGVCAVTNSSLWGGGSFTARVSGRRQPRHSRTHHQTSHFPSRPASACSLSSPRPHIPVVSPMGAGGLAQDAAPTSPGHRVAFQMPRECLFYRQTTTSKVTASPYVYCSLVFSTGRPQALLCNCSSPWSTAHWHYSYLHGPVSM